MSKLKIMLLVIMVAGLAMLTGCEGRLESDLQVNDDLSGTRVYTLTAKKSDLRTGFFDDGSKVINEIKNGTPKELSFRDRSSGDQAVLEFTLDFTDLDDYEEKIDALIVAGGDLAPADAVVYEMPESPFASGMLYQENFKMDAPMKWLENLLIEKTALSESNRKDIFGEKVSSYDIKGISGSGMTIDINDIEYYSLDEIDIYTIANGDGTFDRKIEVRIPNEAMEKNRVPITKFLEANEGGKIFGEWKTSGTKTVYCLSAEKLTAEELDGFMRGFYGKDSGTYFEYSVTSAWKYRSNYNELAKNAAGFFYSMGGVKETVDLSLYTGGNSETLKSTYFVFRSNSAVGKLTLDNGYSMDVSSIGDNKFSANGYSEFFSQDAPVYSLEYAYSNGIHADSADVELSVKRNGDVKRTVTVHFTAEISEDEISDVKKEVESYLEGILPEDDSRASIKLKSIKADDTGFSIEVVSESKGGDKVGEDELWQGAFGANNEIYVTSSTQAILPLAATVCMNESFDLNSFSDGTIDRVTYTVKGVIPEGGEQYVMTYSDFDSTQPINVFITGKSSGISVIAGDVLGVFTLIVLAFAVWAVTSFILGLPYRRTHR